MFRLAAVALAACRAAPVEPWDLATEFQHLVPGALASRLTEEGILPKGGAPSVLIAPAWSADYSGGMFGANSRGRYHYDAAGQRNRQTFAGPSPIFGKQKVSYIDSLSAHTGGVYDMNMTNGRGAEAVCKPVPNKFVDPFAWLAMAKPAGTKTLDGVRCKVYALQVSFKGADATFATCIADDGAPRELLESVPGQGIFGGGLHYTFGNVTVGPQDPDVFKASEACEKFPLPPCPDNEVVELDLYRVHGAAEPASLENRNLGDASGDMAFFCAFDAFRSLNTSLVTRWKVKVNASYSQYSYCLYRGGKNVCIGGVPGRQTVGRESALGQGVGSRQGQCSPNEDVGTWYSFPSEGLCPPGGRVGQGGCTWAEAYTLRTVTAKCILQDRGLLASCKEEFGKPPFTRSIAIFTAALASADPARGGCPDAPSEEGLLVV